METTPQSSSHALTSAQRLADKRRLEADRRLFQRFRALRRNEVAGLADQPDPTGAGSRGKPSFEEVLAAMDIKEDAVQADMLMRAAGHHHARIEALAKTEWTVSLAYWTGLLFTSAALIHAAGGDKRDIAFLIYENSFVILAGLLVSVYVFVFGFSANQSQSIATERNRFLTYQAAALRAAGFFKVKIIASKDNLPTVTNAELLVKPKFSTLESSPTETFKVEATHYSVVWANKLVSSTAFVFSAWMTTMYIAGARSTLPLGVGTFSCWAAGNMLLSFLLAGTWSIVTFYILRRARKADR